MLELDEFEHTGFKLRPHLPLAATDENTGPLDRPPAEHAPISSLLEPLTLDALTVADDPGWLDRIAAERNLPDYLAPALRDLYEQH
jgi:hypothetical protein